MLGFSLPHRVSIVVVSALMCASIGSSVLAQDKPSKVEEAIDALDQALKNEPGLSDATKDALSKVVGMLKTEHADTKTSDKLDKMIEEYTKKTTAYSKRQAYQGIFSHLKIGGDFRFRLEQDYNRDGSVDRFRQRVRFRLAMDWALTDELTLNTRLVTGDPNDAQSPHQTLGDGFHKWDSNWDRINLQWKPKCPQDLTVWLGKFTHPFYKNPVYGELVFDEDVGAEGIAAKYTIKGDECSFLEKVDFTLGGYDLLESNAGDDAFALVGQIAATGRFSKCWNATAAAGFYLWGDPTPDGNTSILADNSGNATVDTTGDGIADRFESDFAIFNPIISSTYSRWENWPITVSAEYMLNTEANNDRDEGWAIGASVGRTTKKGDWKFYYQWQVIEQDAVFTPVTGDDFILQTNFRGSVAGIWYMLTDDINLHLWTLVCAREDLGTSPTTDEDENQWRVRLDLNIRF